MLGGPRRLLGLVVGRPSWLVVVELMEGEAENREGEGGEGRTRVREVREKVFFLNLKLIPFPFFLTRLLKQSMHSLEMQSDHFLHKQRFQP